MIGGSQFAGSTWRASRELVSNHCTTFAGRKTPRWAWARQNQDQDHLLQSIYPHRAGIEVDFLVELIKAERYERRAHQHDAIEPVGDRKLASRRVSAATSSMSDPMAPIKDVGLACIFQAIVWSTTHQANSGTLLCSRPGFLFLLLELDRTSIAC